MTSYLGSIALAVVLTILLLTLSYSLVFVYGIMGETASFIYMGIIT